MHCENYINTLYRPPQHPNGAPCTRWWACPSILVGGSIVSEIDAWHLKDLGITHVLSVESERTDLGCLGLAGLEGHESSFEDVGDREQAIPAILDGILYACSIKGKPVFYVHCQMGGSRSPAMAYALLRSLFGYSTDRALSSIRHMKPEYANEAHGFGRTYIAAAEEALIRYAASVTKRVW
mgnify:FL=1